MSADHRTAVATAYRLLHDRVEGVYGLRTSRWRRCAGSRVGLVKDGGGMTAENNISLIAITVSLLSVLIAACSLREAKTARAETTEYKLLNRKTELSVLLSDVHLKATEVRILALDCLDKIMDKNLVENNEGHTACLTLDSVNYAEALHKAIDALKLELNQVVKIDVIWLEKLHAEYGGYLRELDKQKMILGRVDKWAKEKSEPSV